MNVTHLFYASLFVFLFYRILSSILIFRLSRGDIFLSILQLFDISFIVTLKINYQFPNVMSCSPHRYIANLEAMFEAYPQCLIQLYFLISYNIEQSSSNTSTDNRLSINQFNSLTVSILLSLISILSSKWTQDKELVFYPWQSFNFNYKKFQSLILSKTKKEKSKNDGEGSERRSTFSQLDIDLDMVLDIDQLDEVDDKKSEEIDLDAFLDDIDDQVDEWQRQSVVKHTETKDEMDYGLKIDTISIVGNGKVAEKKQKEKEEEEPLFHILWVIRIIWRFMDISSRLCVWFLIWRVVGAAWFVSFLLFEFIFYLALYILTKEFILLQCITGFVCRVLFIDLVNDEKFMNHRDMYDLFFALCIYQVFTLSLAIVVITILLSLWSLFLIEWIIIVCVGCIPPILMWLFSLFCCDGVWSNLPQYSVFLLTMTRFVVYLVIIVLFGYIPFFTFVFLDVVVLYSIFRFLDAKESKISELNHNIVHLLKLYIVSISKLMLLTKQSINGDNSNFLHGFQYFMFIFYNITLYLFIFLDVNVLFVNDYQTQRYIMINNKLEFNIVLYFLIYVTCCAIIMPIFTYILQYELTMVNLYSTNDRSFPALAETGDVLGLIEISHFGKNVESKVLKKYLQTAIFKDNFIGNLYHQIPLVDMLHIMQYLKQHYDLRLSLLSQMSFVHQIQEKQKQWKLFIKGDSDPKVLKEVLGCFDILLWPQIALNNVNFKCFDPIFRGMLATNFKKLIDAKKRGKFSKLFAIFIAFVAEFNYRANTTDDVDGDDKKRKEIYLDLLNLTKKARDRMIKLIKKIRHQQTDYVFEHLRTTFKNNDNADAAEFDDIKIDITKLPIVYSSFLYRMGFKDSKKWLHFYFKLNSNPSANVNNGMQVKITDLILKKSFGIKYISKIENKIVLDEPVTIANPDAKMILFFGNRGEKKSNDTMIYYPTRDEYETLRGEGNYESVDLVGGQHSIFLNGENNNEIVSLNLSNINRYRRGDTNWNINTDVAIFNCQTKLMSKHKLLFDGNMKDGWERLDFMFAMGSSSNWLTVDDS